MKEKSYNLLLMFSYNVIKSIFIFIIFFFLIYFSEKVYSQTLEEIEREKINYKEFSISPTIKFDYTVKKDINSNSKNQNPLDNILFGLETLHRIDKYFASGLGIFFSDKGYLESNIQLRIFIIPEGLLQPYIGIDLNYVSFNDSFFSTKFRSGLDISILENLYLNGNIYLGFNIEKSEPLLSWSVSTKILF